MKKYENEKMKIKIMKKNKKLNKQEEEQIARENLMMIKEQKM